MELKGMFIVQVTTSLYGVWIPNLKYAEGKPWTWLLAKHLPAPGGLSPRTAA